MTEQTGLADAVEQVARSVVAVLGGGEGRPRGAGWVWQSGVVLSTASVAGRGGALRLVGADGVAVAAELRGLAVELDLAVLVTDAALAAAAVPALDTTPRVGDAVMAVGRERSGGVQAGFGRLGHVGLAWRTWRGGELSQRLRLDGGLYAGLEGAAVATEAGHFIGLASSAFSRHHGVIIPHATLQAVVPALLAHGQLPRAYLGLGAQPVELADRSIGLLVSAVADNAPAAQAGVMVGDIVLALQGQPVADLAALRQQLNDVGIGQPAQISLLRGGQPLELAATVAPAPRHTSACRGGRCGR